MKRTKNGSTRRQELYAENRLNGAIFTKKESALRAGYAPSVANSVSVKIENTEGYANAVTKLYGRLGNVAMQAVIELERRGFEMMTDKDVISSIGLLVKAHDTLDPSRRDDGNKATNILRDILMRSKAIETESTTAPEPEPNPFDI